MCTSAAEKRDHTSAGRCRTQQKRRIRKRHCRPQGENTAEGYAQLQIFESDASAKSPWTVEAPTAPCSSASRTKCSAPNRKILPSTARFSLRVQGSVAELKVLPSSARFLHEKSAFEADFRLKAFQWMKERCIRGRNLSVGESAVLATQQHRAQPQPPRAQPPRAWLQPPLRATTACSSRATSPLRHAATTHQAATKPRSRPACQGSGFGGRPAPPTAPFRPRGYTMYLQYRLPGTRRRPGTGLARATRPVGTAPAGNGPAAPPRHQRAPATSARPAPSPRHPEQQRPRQPCVARQPRQPISSRGTR